MTKSSSLSAKGIVQPMLHAVKTVCECGKQIDGDHSMCGHCNVLRQAKLRGQTLYACMAAGCAEMTPFAFCYGHNKNLSAVAKSEARHGYLSAHPLDPRRPQPRTANPRIETYDPATRKTAKPVEAAKPKQVEVAPESIPMSGTFAHVSIRCCGRKGCYTEALDNSNFCRLHAEEEEEINRLSKPTHNIDLLGLANQVIAELLRDNDPEEIRKALLELRAKGCGAQRLEESPDAQKLAQEYLAELEAAQQAEREAEKEEARRLAELEASREAKRAAALAEKRRAEEEAAKLRASQIRANARETYLKEGIKGLMSLGRVYEGQPVEVDGREYPNPHFTVHILDVRTDMHCKEREAAISQARSALEERQRKAKEERLEREKAQRDAKAKKSDGPKKGKSSGDQKPKTKGKR